MNIALIVPGGVDRSGEYRVIPVLLALIARLSRNHTVHVFSLHQEPEPGSWQLAGAQVHNIGRERTRTRAVRAILAQHRETPFDVIHSIWSGTCGLVAVAAALLLQRPSLIHIAGGELVALSDIGFGGRLTWRGRIREALVLQTATLVTSASAPIIESLYALGVDARRVPLGVDLDMWPPRSPERRRAESPARLVHVASLNRVKDQSTLLRATQRLMQAGVDFHLDIIGEDTLDGEIQALARELGLTDRVTFHGFLPAHAVRPFVYGADVLVVSSRHETGPLVMLEAAAAGVPTVGTAVGHVSEWAPEAACAVPVGDWAALAHAIGQLLSNEELRLKIANEALRRAVAEDADRTALLFERLYDEATASKAARRWRLRPSRP